MRSITEVIERIKKEVPESLDKQWYPGYRKFLFEQLDKNIDSPVWRVPYKAKETRWEDLEYTLEFFFQEADTPWKRRIADIMAGRV